MNLSWLMNSCCHDRSHKWPTAWLKYATSAGLLITFDVEHNCDHKTHSDAWHISTYSLTKLWRTSEACWTTMKIHQVGSCCYSHQLSSISQSYLYNQNDSYLLKNNIGYRQGFINWQKLGFLPGIIKKFSGSFVHFAFKANMLR
jgi:hypothetical protein